MTDKVFPEGIRVFKPHGNAPSFIKSKVKIDKKELIEWLNDQPDDTINLNINESKQGKYYMQVDNFQPENQTESKPEPKPQVKPINEEPDDLPF